MSVIRIDPAGRLNKKSALASNVNRFPPRSFQPPAGLHNNSKVTAFASQGSLFLRVFNVIRTGYSVPRSLYSVSIPLLRSSGSRPSPSSKKDGSSSLELWPFTETLLGAAPSLYLANQTKFVGSSREVLPPPAYSVCQRGILFGSTRTPSPFGLSQTLEVLTLPLLAALFHAAYAHGVCTLQSFSLPKNSCWLVTNRSPLDDFPPSRRSVTAPSGFSILRKSVTA